MGAVPLRPLTLGELLDAAVALVRRSGLPLLLTAVGLAAVEQVLLVAFVMAFGTEAPVSTVDRLSAPPFQYLGSLSFAHLWMRVAAGMGTEGAIITLLGGLAGRVVVPDLLGPGTPRPPRRVAPLLLLALFTGVCSAVGMLFGALPWLCWYLLAGLAGPALTVQLAGPLRAVGRSVTLTARARLRPGRIRLLGYLGWAAIRVAFGLGNFALVDLIGSHLVAGLAGLAATVLVNTVAYTALGCLDAVLLVETRMRVEGLDIALSRARRRGLPAGPILVGR